MVVTAKTPTGGYALVAQKEPLAALPPLPPPMFAAGRPLEPQARPSSPPKRGPREVGPDAAPGSSAEAAPPPDWAPLMPSRAGSVSGPPTNGPPPPAAARAIPREEVQTAAAAPLTPAMKAAELNKLGEQSYLAGELKGAERRLLKALAMREEALGPLHGDTLASVCNVAALRLAQGRPGDALPLAQRALEGRTAAAARGEAREDEVGRAARLVGDAFGALGKRAKAAAAYEQALRALQPAAGQADSEEALEVCEALAELERARGHAKEAAALYERVLRSVPFEAQEVGLLQTVADVSEEAGDLPRAEALHRRVLTLQTAALDSAVGPSAEAGWTLNTLALLCEGQGRFEEAERLYRRAVSTLEETLGTEDPNAAAAHSNLGAFLLKRGRPGDAVGPLQYALLVSEAVLGAGHEDSKDTAAWLAEALDGAGRTPDAAALRAKYRLPPPAPGARVASRTLQRPTSGRGRPGSSRPRPGGLAVPAGSRPGSSRSRGSVGRVPPPAAAASEARSPLLGERLEDFEEEMGDLSFRGPIVQ